MAPLMATALGFLLLTANSIIAIHRSWGDAAATIFVIASYACLPGPALLLPSPLQDRSARLTRQGPLGVWLMTTLLTARVAVLVPWSVGDGVCLMGGCTVAGGFYALFLLPSPQGDC
jgi:hypothetical protein